MYSTINVFTVTFYQFKYVVAEKKGMLGYKIIKK